MDVETLRDDVRLDINYTQVEGAQEPRLVRAISTAVAYVRQLQITYLGLDQFVREQNITLNGAAWYTAVNLGGVAHAEIALTRERVGQCGVWDRAQGLGPSYPTGSTITLHYVPRWPRLFQATAVGGSTTYVDLPTTDEQIAANVTAGDIETEDNRLTGVLFETLSGTGAGQVLLGGAFDGSTGRLNVTLEDGSAPAALGADTVLCTYLGDIDELFRWFISDLVLAVTTAKQKKSDVLEAKIRAVVSLLGKQADYDMDSTEDNAIDSGLRYRRSGQRLQFLGIADTEPPYPFNRMSG